MNVLPTRRSPVVAILAVGLVLAVYAASILFYTLSQNASGVGLTPDQSGTADRLTADITTTSIDAIKGDLLLRIQMTPEGGLLAGDGASLAQPVSVVLNSATGKSSYQFKAGERVNPIEAVVSLDSAGGAAYPFDRYNGEFFMSASMAPAPAAATAATTDTAAPATAVPIALTFDGALAGYRVDANHISTENPEDVDISIALSRAPVTVAFALGVLLLMLMIAVGALTLGLLVLRRKRVAELAMLTWLTAMLFALTPLRNAMPAVPPIGIMVDVVVYFWVIVAVAASLLMVLSVVLRKKPAPA